MTYIGRTQTYTFSGTISGQFGVITGEGSPCNSHTEFSISVGGFYIIQFSAAQRGNVFDCTLSVNGYVVPTSGDTVTWTHSNSSDPYNYVDTVSGSYTITIEVEEAVDITEGTPTTNPQVVDEYPFAIDVQVGLQCFTGAAVSMSATYDGETASISGTWNGGGGTGFSTGAVIVVSGFNYNSGPGLTASITPNWNGTGVTGVSGSDGSGGYAFAWGSSVSVTFPGSIPGYPCATLSYSVGGTIVYDLEGVVGAWGGAYPSDLTVQQCTGVEPNTSTPRIVDLTVSGGAYSTTIVQNLYSVTCFGGTLTGTYPLNYNDIGPVYGALTSASLSDVGEDTDLALQNLWMRGWAWNACSIGQAPSITALSGSWDATGPSGTISVSSSDFASSLQGSNWVGASLGGYAYANIFLTADEDDQPARIHLGGNYWDVTVGTSGSIQIDLTNPTSKHGAVDGVDSQWEWQGAPLGPYTAQSGWSSGIRNATVLTIDTLASGHDYTLTEIQLTQLYHADLTFLDPFKGWVKAFPPNTVADVTTTFYYRRARQGDTDGQQSHESTDWVWEHSHSELETTDTFYPIPILNLVAMLQNGTAPQGATAGVFPIDGWSATDLQPTDSSENVYNGLLNSNLPSCLLYGSGMFYNGTTWVGGFNQSVADTLTVPGQYLFNSVQTYAAAGDIWGWSDGSFGGPTKLRPAIVLRGQAWGLENDTSGRVSGTLVTAAVDDVSAGSGTTDSTGEYMTGLPYVIGLNIATVTAENGFPYPSLTEAFATRQRRRVRFDQGCCCNFIFCSNNFFFPFPIQAGDSALVPLEDWRAIPAVSGVDAAASSSSNNSSSSDASPAVAEPLMARAAIATAAPPKSNLKSTASEPTWTSSPGERRAARNVGSRSLPARTGDVDCIITCHNYGRYLAQCIESCLAQTVAFRTIFVVDDSSTDDTPTVATRYANRGVKYIRVDHRNVSLARRAGVNALPRQRFLLFVDADNYLEPNYAEALLRPMDDSALGVAYAPVRQFDAQGAEGWPEWIRPYDFDALRVRNFADNCSLIRREAYDQVGGYPDPGDHQTFADWLLWLRVTRNGWTMRKVDDTHLNYRVHPNRMTVTAGSRDFPEEGALKQGLSVTIVTLFAGREWALPRHFEYLGRLKWPAANLHLVAVDNSGSVEFEKMLKERLEASALTYSYVRYTKQTIDGELSAEFADSVALRVKHPYEMNIHMAQLYALARRAMPSECDIVWSLEDDIEPPDDALERLMWSLAANPDADVAAGAAIDRFSGGLLAWHEVPRGVVKREELAAKFSGAKAGQVLGTGFMCTLFRRAIWDRLAFRPTYSWNDQHCGYDWAAAYEVRRMNRQWLLCGDVVCKHWKSDGTFV